MILTLPVLTQTGIAIYGTNRELVPPETLSAPEFLASFAGRPVVYGEVGTKNPADGRPFIAAVVGPARYDGDVLSVDVEITDTETTAKMQEDPHTIGLGKYVVDLKWTPGVDSKHGAYDAVQSNRRLSGPLELLPVDVRQADIAVASIGRVALLTKQTERARCRYVRRHIQPDSVYNNPEAIKVIIHQGSKLCQSTRQLRRLKRREQAQRTVQRVRASG